MPVSLLQDFFIRGSNKLAKYTKAVHLSAYFLVLLGVPPFLRVFDLPLPLGFGFAILFNLLLFIFLWRIPATIVEKKKIEGKNWNGVLAVINLWVIRSVIFPMLCFFLFLLFSFLVSISAKDTGSKGLAEKQSLIFPKVTHVQNFEAAPFDSNSPQRHVSASSGTESCAKEENTLDTEALVSKFKETKTLAETGDAEAQFQLAKLYRKGKGVAKDDQAALAWYKKAGSQGLTKALYNLGWMYKHGDGVPKDGNEAIHWYTKAAKLNDSDAMFSIANTYCKGNGIPKDGEKAIYWYTKAADLGHVEAMYNMANTYCKGNGIPKDGEKAIYWYTKAADLGHLNAVYNMAHTYCEGDVVTKAPLKGLKWYTKAAEKGHTLAQYNLGRMYAIGDGVPRDIDKGIYWLSKAAEKGYRSAQYSLAMTLHFEKKRDVEAVKWLHLAFLQGEKIDSDWQKSLVRNISKEDMFKGLALAEEWMEAFEKKN